MYDLETLDQDRINSLYKVMSLYFPDLKNINKDIIKCTRKYLTDRKINISSDGIDKIIQSHRIYLSNKSDKTYCHISEKIDGVYRENFIHTDSSNYLFFGIEELKRRFSKFNNKNITVIVMERKGVGE